MQRLLLIGSLFAVVALGPAWSAAEQNLSVEKVQPEADVVFETHIRPIFQAACFHCHGEEAELSGGLDLRLRRFMLQGGDAGPALVPGQPEASS